MPNKKIFTSKKSSPVLWPMMIVLGVVALAFGSSELMAQDEAAQAATAPLPVAIEDALADRVLGKDDAPVTLIEYASLTCSHCATFHTKTLPVLVKEFVDTGKLKIIFRDFPLDGTALRAAALARCLPEERYFAFLKLLFEKQSVWAGPEADAQLTKFAALAGLGEEEAKACMGNTKLLDGLVTRRQEGEKAYQVTSTPSFVLNNGSDVITGAQPVDEFRKRIKKALTPATPAPAAPPAAAAPATAPAAVPEPPKTPATQAE